MHFKLCYSAVGFEVRDYKCSVELSVRLSADLHIEMPVAFLLVDHFMNEPWTTSIQCF